MIGTGIAIQPPPEQPLEVQGLLRLCADPNVAKALLEHREAWQKIHDDNAALLKSIAKVKNVERAQAKADAASKEAGAALARAQAQADVLIAQSREEAEDITRQAKTQLDGFDHRRDVLDEQQTVLDRKADELDKRDKATAKALAAAERAKTAAVADRKAAAEAKKQVEALLKGV